MKQLFIVLVLGILVMGCAKRQMVMSGEQAKPAASGKAQAKSMQMAAGPEWKSAPQLEAVYFGFKNHGIGPKAKEILKKNAEFLKSNPGKNMLVELHCDNQGDIEYNKTLGQERANSVKNYYGELGISLDKISTMVIVDTQENEGGWKMNRRAETKIK